MDKDVNRYASDADGVINDGYTVPTFKNLSKLYWALAMFDLADNQAIDSYLMINECELYKKYYNSDFELEGLREATRESITKNIAKFPTKFEIMIPVGLDRYNTGTEKFLIDPRSQFVGAKRLEVAVNDSMADICGNGGESVPKYPRNFILSLNRPFTVTEISVPPEVAQFYIEQAEKEAPTHPYRHAYSKFNRVAYLRLKVTMNQFRGYAWADASNLMADIFGTIDSYEMYGDRDKTLLMYNPEVDAKRKAGIRKEPIQLPGSGEHLIQTPADQAARDRAKLGRGGDISPETGDVETKFKLPPGFGDPNYSSASTVPQPAAKTP